MTDKASAGGSANGALDFLSANTVASEERPSARQSRRIRAAGDAA